MKDAYFMIPIAWEDQEFQWKDSSYQFNCLPFGLSLAPWVFTKTRMSLIYIYNCGGSEGGGGPPDYILYQ